MSEPLPAATVIVARDAAPTIEVFLLRRSARSSFMPDVYVFPGGRIEGSDAAPPAQARLAGADTSAEGSARFGAARETFEEAGLLFARPAVHGPAVAAARAAVLAGSRSFEQILDDLGAVVDGDALVPFSRWITPLGEGKRFDARFFVARAPAAPIARADARETSDGRWLTPADALAQNATGTLALIFPTIKHLERLLPFADVDALLAFARDKPIVPVMPDIREGCGPFLADGLENAW